MFPLLIQHCSWLWSVCQGAAVGFRLACGRYTGLAACVASAHTSLLLCSLAPSISSGKSSTATVSGGWMSIQTVFSCIMCSSMLLRTAGRQITVKMTAALCLQDMLHSKAAIHASQHCQMMAQHYLQQVKHTCADNQGSAKVKPVPLSSSTPHV